MHNSADSVVAIRGQAGEEVNGRRQACAHAAELTLAVPESMRDIYALHQHVWRHVKQSQAIDHWPTILYRRDGGLVRVRVSDCAMIQTRHRKIDVSFGEVVSIELAMALWRDTGSGAGDPTSRVVRLIESAGVEIESIATRHRVASGYKARLASRIELPIADVKVTARVLDPQALVQAWKFGIGRGRRFGFGMPVLQ